MWAVPRIYMAMKSIVIFFFSHMLKVFQLKTQTSHWSIIILVCSLFKVVMLTCLLWALVIMDQLSEWIEAFPTRKTATVGMILTRYGIPENTEPAGVSHFPTAILNNIYKILGTQWQLHIQYHSQSSGEGKRMNKTLRNKIAWIYSQVALKWLPEWPLGISQWAIRNTLWPQAEIVFGRHLAVSATSVPAMTSLLDGKEQTTKFIPGTQKHVQQKKAQDRWFQPVLLLGCLLYLKALEWLLPFWYQIFHCIDVLVPFVF